MLRHHLTQTLQKTFWTMGRAEDSRQLPQGFLDISWATLKPSPRFKAFQFRGRKQQIEKT